MFSALKWCLICLWVRISRVTGFVTHILTVGFSVLGKMRVSSSLATLGWRRSKMNDWVASFPFWIWIKLVLSMSWGKSKSLLSRLSTVSLMWATNLSLGEWNFKYLERLSVYLVIENLSSTNSISLLILYRRSDSLCETTIALSFSAKSSSRS